MERWHAIYVKSRCEKKTAFFLAAHGLQHYLPTVMKQRRWKGRKREVEVPLFPGYVFLRRDFEADCAYDSRVEILRMPGVVKIVGAGSPLEPVLHVPDQEIFNIKTVLERKMKVDPYRYSVAVGQTVRITKGPLAGVEGVVVERRGVYRLILHVKLIMQAVAVEIHPGDIET